MAYDQDLAHRLREVLGTEAGLTERRMFGGLAFLIDGNLAVAVSREGGLLLRVPPERTDQLLTRRHTRTFVMRDRPMEGWIRVDAEGVRTKRELERWVLVGLGYARKLPKKTAAGSRRR